MADPIPITLENLGHGAAGEKFAAALAQVLDNIADPNTDPEAVRRITLTFAFEPDKERRAVDVTINATAKLVSAQGHTVGIVVGQHLGKRMAVGLPGQDDLFKTPQGGPRALPTAAGGSPPASS